MPKQKIYKEERTAFTIRVKQKVKEIMEKNMKEDKLSQNAYIEKLILNDNEFKTRMKVNLSK